MPTKKVTTSFHCDTCSRKFDNYDSALNCENRGYAIPEFFDGAVVQLSALEKKSELGVVLAEYVEEGIDKHCLPAVYEVSVIDRKPGNPSRMSVLASHMCMKPFIFKDKKCPMCESKNVADHIEERYVPFNFPYIPIEKVKMSKCSDCGVRFFLDYEKAQELILSEARKIKMKINEDKEYY